MLENKKKQLIDIRMEGILTKEDFEEQYKELNDKVEKKKALLSRASSEIDKKEFIASRLEDFKKIISIKNGNDEFDREIFEMLVDKVIIGGYDEQGNPDPYAIEFRFKIDYNFKINGQAIKKKYTVCQNESNDLGSLTTYCQVHSVQVLQNLQSHSVHTFSEIYKSSDIEGYFFIL